MSLAAQPKDPCGISLWDTHTVSQSLLSCIVPNGVQLRPPETHRARPDRQLSSRFDGSRSHSPTHILSVFLSPLFHQIWLIYCRESENDSPTPVSHTVRNKVPSLQPSE